MPTFYLSSVTSLSFFCLFFDYKQYMLQASCPQERPKSSVELQDAALGLVKVTSSVETSSLETLSWEQQQIEVPNSAVFAYPYLLNNIFHSFLLLSS